MTKEKALEKIDEWIDKQVGSGSVTIPDVAKALLDKFDAKTLTIAMKDAMYAWAYDRVQRAVKSTRAVYVNTSGEVESVADGTAQEPGETTASRFAGWMERVGEEGHKALMDLTKKELDAAIEQRSSDVRVGLERLYFLRNIRRGVKGSKRVRDAFEPSDLERLWQESQRQASGDVAEAVA